MKITILSILFVSAISSICMAKRTQRKAYPELRAIRKVYVLDPHKFGYWAPGHIKRGLRKSKCMELASDPMQADAILMPVMYPWLDKFGGGSVGSCVSSNATLSCNDGNEIELLHCDSSGCTVGSVPGGGNRNLEWILIDPKTGNRMSNWTMKEFPSAKKVEEAVGCP